MIQQTSLQAYLELQRKNKLNENETIILDIIKRKPGCTINEIAKYLGWPDNRVSGRTNSLKNKGKIIALGLKKNKSGHAAQTLYQKTEENSQ